MLQKPDNLRRITRNIIRTISDYWTFADYKRKAGISPLLANKDRGTSIRKTIINYGQTKYFNYCQELLTT